MKNSIVLFLKLFFISFILQAQTKEIRVDSLNGKIIKAIFNKALKDKDTIGHESSFNYYPYVFYSPETDVAFGAGGIYISIIQEKKKY